MPTRKSYTPPAGLSPSASENGWADTVPKTWVCIVWKDKLLFILWFIHGGGGQGGAVQATEHACFGKRRLVLYVARLPGRETTRLRCLPQTPRLGLLAEQKEQLHPGKQIAFLRPIDFLIFWHFLVASIPFLVFSSMSQKTKMSKQLRAEISISCQTAVFPALTKRAHHTECRELVRWQIISFFSPLNKDNHIPIPWLLLANQNMLWEKGKKSHCIRFCNFYYVSCICWEGGKREENSFKERNNTFQVAASEKQSISSSLLSPKNCFDSASTTLIKETICYT